MMTIRTWRSHRAWIWSLRVSSGRFIILFRFWGKKKSDRQWGLLIEIGVQRNINNRYQFIYLLASTGLNNMHYNIQL